MKKSDLEYGNVVELRNGDKYLYNFVTGYKLLNLTTCGGYLELYHFNEDLTNCCNLFDVMKVYKDYTLTELLWERKDEPKPKLTEDEKVILKNLPKEYKWIARDKSGLIFLCSKKPSKCDYSWIGYNDIAFPFYHLFQFIKWEDDEPYLIEDLLGEEK